MIYGSWRNSNRPFLKLSTSTLASLQYAVEVAVWANGTAIYIHLPGGARNMLHLGEEPSHTTIPTVQVASVLTSPRKGNTPKPNGASGSTRLRFSSGAIDGVRFRLTSAVAAGAAVDGEARVSLEEDLAAPSAVQSQREIVCLLDAMRDRSLCRRRPIRPAPLQVPLALMGGRAEVPT